MAQLQFRGSSDRDRVDSTRSHPVTPAEEENWVDALFALQPKWLGQMQARSIRREVTMSQAQRNQLTVTNEAAPSLAVWQFFERDGFRTDPSCDGRPPEPLASQSAFGGRQSLRVRLARAA